MKYNAAVHRRRSIRLPGYDYRTPGAYFITICTRQGESLFDDREFTSRALIVWQIVVEKDGLLDEFVVMPNHVHGIIWITEPTL